MRAVLAVGLVLLVSTNGVGQEKKEPPKLDGKYLIVSMEKGGMSFPADVVKMIPEAERTVMIAGDKLSTIKNGKEDAVAIKLDPSKTPAEITTTEKKPDGTTQTAVGIYKIDGDTLTLCIVESGDAKDRPKEFKTAKDSKAMILVLKRTK